MDITPTPNSPLPRRESIPGRLLAQFRKTGEDMLKSTPRDAGISYEILGKSPKGNNVEPKMTADTAAIYIGKLCPPSFVEEISHHAFGFQAPERIYGDEFIKAFLDYAFRHTPPGEKVRIIIGLSLSKLLNGKDDTKGVYTLQEEAQRIHMIAAFSFPKRLPDLELVAMEDVRGNLELFQRLARCKDPTTGEVDIDRAYGEEMAHEIKLSSDSSALEIAQFLYRACQENDRLKDIFFRMRPGKVRNMDYPESSKYYGLTEIAIRLKAILSGQKLHIGAERQDVYDKWIVAIIRGKNQNGQFRDFTELYPLYELFKGKEFETVHISTRNNAYRNEKDKKLARTRAFIFGSVISCLALGGLELYRHFSNKPTAASVMETTPSKGEPIPSQRSPSEDDKTPDVGSELQ